MRKLVFAFFLPAAIFFGVATYFYKFIYLNTNSFFYWSACDKPIRYALGVVDERFNLSEDEFLSDTAGAASIWNNTLGKTLFLYDPQGELTINLVFDQRQSLTNDISQLENQIKTGKNSLDPQISEYEKLAEDFKKRISDLNARIDFWNSQGGAPKDEYEKLTKEQSGLKEEADRLNAMAKSLNLSTKEYNTKVGTLNQTVKSFNEVISQKPEEGLYRGKENSIDIYFNINNDELVHTLAHELGHAIGLDHNANSESIMYPYTTQVLVPSMDDAEQLKKICQKHTVVAFAINRFMLNLQQLIAQYQK